MGELMDKDSRREWTTKQLSTVVEVLESSQMCSNMDPQELSYFFVETTRQLSADDLLKRRVMGCLETLALWGSSAANALAELGDTKRLESAVGEQCSKCICNEEAEKTEKTQTTKEDNIVGTQAKENNDG